MEKQQKDTGYGIRDARSHHPATRIAQLASFVGMLCIANIAHAQNTLITNPTSRPVPVAIVTGGLTPGGAAHQANGQVTSSTTAATLVIARATRVGVSVTNIDSAITVYVGAATVTSGNGVPLLPGQSQVFNSVGLIQVIAASGTPKVSYWDEYN